MSCNWLLTFGAVSTLPCETNGLAPTISRKLVRFRSGIGISAGEPYSSALAAKRFATSCEEAV